MTAFPAIDAKGNDLLLGDWVRVLMVPLSAFRMPEDSRRVFSAAVGKTFQIEGFDSTGCLELDLWPKIGLDTIWVEPDCVAGTRRPAQRSKAFDKKRQLQSAPPPPRLELEFDIVAWPGVDLEALGLSIINLASGGGFAVWPQERRLKGSVYANMGSPNPIALLKHTASTIRVSDSIESFTIGEVPDAEI